MESFHISTRSDPAKPAFFSQCTEHVRDNLLLTNAITKNAPADAVGMLWLHALPIFFSAVERYSIIVNHDFPWPIIEVYDCKIDPDTCKQQMTLLLVVHCFSEIEMEHKLEGMSMDGRDSVDQGHQDGDRDQIIWAYTTTGSRYGQTFSVVQAEGPIVFFRQMTEDGGAPVWNNHGFETSIRNESDRRTVDDCLRAIKDDMIFE
jgi:hypothetical protein